ncbi:hypothetical protein [Thiofilum flexile]|uniref:hypothetical protein n=1 Tax=Thiofilum flexile TaxID=125627 RepID=UPI000362A37E|nr:hypothetical protein [Thiofilum flexile]
MFIPNYSPYAPNSSAISREHKGYVQTANPFINSSSSTKQLLNQLIALLTQLIKGMQGSNQPISSNTPSASRLTLGQDTQDALAAAWRTYNPNRSQEVGHILLKEVVDTNGDGRLSAGDTLNFQQGQLPLGVDRVLPTDDPSVIISTPVTDEMLLISLPFYDTSRAPSGRFSQDEDGDRGSLVAQALRALGYRDFMAGPEPISDIIRVILRVGEGEPIPTEADIRQLINNSLANKEIGGKPVLLQEGELNLEVVVSNEPLGELS